MISGLIMTKGNGYRTLFRYGQPEKMADMKKKVRDH